MIKLSNGKIFNELQIEKIVPWEPMGGLKGEVPTIWDIHFISGTKHSLTAEEKVEVEKGLGK